MQLTKTFFGKIEGINDLVTFEGKTVDKLISSFHETVDDYLELCLLKKRTAQIFQGSFNVRVNPQIHARAYHTAKALKLSLISLYKSLENII